MSLGYVKWYEEQVLPSKSSPTNLSRPHQETPSLKKKESPNDKKLSLRGHFLMVL